MTVSVGIVTAGELRAELVQSILLAREETAYQHIWIKINGPYMDMGRNDVVRHFLEECDDEWLLFVDSDIAFQSGQIDQLIKSADHELRPIVGGLYYSMFGDRGKLAVAYDYTDKAYGSPAELTQEQIENAPEDLIPVDAVGAGFLLLSRPFLEAFGEHWGPPSPWFAEVPINGVQSGEDLTFCMRAKDMGYQVYLNRACKVDHLKLIRI